MLIFARRALQACLDSLSPTLARDQVHRLVERLNAPGADRLAAMWEVVLLAGIARTTNLTHESALPNGRRPDFAANLGGDISVVGDITTISDAGLRDLNPVDFLSDEIARLARKHGLNGNHFSYRIEGARFDEGPKARARLSLPDKHDLARLLNREIDAFVRDIRRTGKPTAEFKHDDGGSRFTIGYDISQEYMRGAYGSYDGVSGPTRNVLDNALRPKARQLKGADPALLRLILVCDGGCSLMRRPYNHGTRGLLHSRDVAVDFLRRNSSIDAIGLVTVSDGRPKPGALRSPHERLAIELDLVLSPKLGKGRLTETSEVALRQMLGEVIDAIPQPIDTPFHVGRLWEFESSAARLRGGWGMSGNSVRISTRALVQLLAGTLSHAEFMELHGWDNDHTGSFSNLFLCLLREGRRLTEVSLALDTEPDDDWITFDFDGFDAASAPFAVSGDGDPAPV